MRHLVIGAAKTAHIREYARSWEQATQTRPLILGWDALCAADVNGSLDGEPPSLGDLLGVDSNAPVAVSGSGTDARQPLAVRFAAPTGAEADVLATTLGGAPAGTADVEAAPAALLGLLRGAARLDQALIARGIVPCHATPPRSLAMLLDRDARYRALLAERVPQPTRWQIEPSGAHECYEALRDRLRQVPGRRVVVQLARSATPSPTVLVWMGGRGIRAQANCCFTPVGAGRSPLHALDDETLLRPLLGRFFELGAVVDEEWACAELNGRPFSLTLLVAGNRVVLGQVGPGGPFRVRGELPEPGIPLDLPEVRRQMDRDLYRRIEETAVRLLRATGCAALVVDVALSRRFDDFAVLDVDPFAEMPPDRRDAVGWTGSDHLVRRVRNVLAGGTLDPPAAPAH